jgi:nucleoside-diphosphate-sugar epimerase
LIFISSTKVNGDATAPGRPFTERDPPAPADPYGASKAQAESELRAFASATAVEIVVIRPPLVYGPGAKENFLKLVRLVARRVPLPLASVTGNRRTLVGVDNLVDLITLALHHPAAANQVFLAGDGEDVSTADLVRRIARAMGAPARLYPVPTPVLRAIGTLLGRQDQIRRLCGSLQVDSSKARTMLGWQPSHSIDEGLRRAVQRLGSEPSGGSS